MYIYVYIYIYIYMTAEHACVCKQTTTRVPQNRQCCASHDVGSFSFGKILIGSKHPIVVDFTSFAQSWRNLKPPGEFQKFHQDCVIFF